MPVHITQQRRPSELRAAAGLNSNPSHFHFTVILSWNRVHDWQGVPTFYDLHLTEQDFDAPVGQLSALLEKKLNKEILGADCSGVSMHSLLFYKLIKPIPRSKLTKERGGWSPEENMQLLSPAKPMADLLATIPAQSLVQNVHFICQLDKTGHPANTTRPSSQLKRLPGSSNQRVAQDYKAFTSKYQLPIHVYHPIFQTLSNIYSSTTITPSTLSPEQHFSLERVLNFSTSYNSSNPFQNQTLPESFCSLMHRMLFERPMDLHGLSQEEKDDLAEHHWFDDVEEDCFSRRQKGSTEMFLLNGKKSAAPVMFLVCTTDYDQMDIDLCAGIEDGIEAVWEDELEGRSHHFTSRLPNPCFVLSWNGRYLGVYGYIHTSTSSRLQLLTDIKITTNPPDGDPSHLNALARLLMAVSTATHLLDEQIAAFEKHIEDILSSGKEEELLLGDKNNSMFGLQRRAFPFADFVKDDKTDRVEKIVWDSVYVNPALRGSPATRASDTVTFRGRLHRTNQVVVLKLVGKYGRGGHEWLAERGYAPALLCLGNMAYYDAIQGKHAEVLVDPFPEMRAELGAAWDFSPTRLLVMESVDEFHLANPRLLHQFQRLCLAHQGDYHAPIFPLDAREQVEKVVREMHLAGWVFGDLRHPNVLFDKEGKVKIIDFNWMGRWDMKRGLEEWIPEADEHHTVEKHEDENEGDDGCESGMDVDDEARNPGESRLRDAAPHRPRSQRRRSKYKNRRHKRSSSYLQQTGDPIPGDFRMQLSEHIKYLVKNRVVPEPEPLNMVASPYTIPFMSPPHQDKKAAPAKGDWVCYTSMLNQQCGWPKSVRWGAEIRPKHDWAMLRLMRFMNPPHLETILREMSGQTRGVNVQEGRRGENKSGNRARI